MHINVLVVYSFALKALWLSFFIGLMLGSVVNVPMIPPYPKDEWVESDKTPSRGQGF
jgi:hypothetical protein